MGLRGPNAKPVRKSTTPKVKRLLAWQQPGLSRVERVVKFIQSLPVTSGTLAGKKFRLRPWQLKIIEGIYREENGRRVVRTALLTIPRKNGKTGLTAALALCHFCGPEAVPRGQVYSAAAERNQAGLLYEEMKAIITRVPWLAKRIIVRDFTKKLEDVETGSVYFALSAEATTKHGFNTSCWIYDELAQATDRRLHDVLATSTGARSEPLGIVISTQSPDPNHIMSELVDYGIQIRDGLIEDPSFYAAIYTAPMDADPWSEETWHACNPALGDFRSIEEMRDYATQAQRVPTREATFRLLYLNQRINDHARFIPQPDWDACGEKPHMFDVPSLKGRACYGALDLSSTGKNDLTALVLLFEVDEMLKTLPFFWAADGGLEEAEKRDRAPYRLWAEQGHLLTTPGRILDYGFIARKLGELTTTYDLKVLAVDPWNHERLVKELDDIGVDLVLQKHGQGIKDMTPAVSALEDVVLSRQLRHNQNPVLTWCMDNISVLHDSSGNRKFDKRKSTGRIDGAQALAMVAGLNASFKGEPTGSYAVTVI